MLTKRCTLTLGKLFCTPKFRSAFQSASDRHSFPQRQYWDSRATAKCEITLLIILFKDLFLHKFSSLVSQPASPRPSLRHSESRQGATIYPLQDTPDISSITFSLESSKKIRTANLIMIRAP